VAAPAYAAIRSKRWLWVEYANGARELYDMTLDPYQLHSLHDDPDYAAVRATLEQQLDKLRACKGGTSQVVPDSCGKERGDPAPPN
jgi:arylsulfatase A-like enzyme